VAPAVAAVVLVVATAVEVLMLDQVAAPAAARVALLAGATGLVGRAVLAALLTDSRIATVHCVGRRPLSLKHPRLVSHVVNFDKLGALPGVGHLDDVFIALGTTIKVAGSEAAFRAVDFEAVLAVARAARAAGATRLGVVSAMGANPSSAIFYNRVKGEMEDALARLGFETLIIVRPSMLAGDRNALHQPARSVENLILPAMRLFKPLIPANYRAISANAVAQALIRAVQDTVKGTRILLSGDMQPRQ
jgi:uncharacterized protein YbjT (DUF2867 family)